jgi:hypothetical protein
MALTKVTQGLFKDFVNKVLAVMQNHSNIFLTTAKAATGTFVDFDIPAGVKRVTVMFEGVSTNGTSPPQIQIGAAAFKTSGYANANTSIAGGVVTANFTSGFGVGVNTSNWAAASVISGGLALDHLGANAWVARGLFGASHAAITFFTGGSASLSSALDRIRITTVNGTDQFDAGTINVSWEF